MTGAGEALGPAAPPRPARSGRRAAGGVGWGGVGEAPLLDTTK